MTILNRLACALNDRSELPNRALARELATVEDAAGVHELVENLTNPSPAIQSDCIKTLYEIGYLKPELIAGYADDFLRLLKSRDNRMVWGGMITLSTIASLAADTVFPHVDVIQKAMTGGSVITRDGGVMALARIAAANPEYNRAIFPFLLHHLETCRPKDVPQHSEKIAPAVTPENAPAFRGLIEKRLENATASEAKRLKKVLKSIA